jgi:uncharacterized membrane protein YqjE
MSLHLGKGESMSVHATDGIVRSGRRMLAILVGMVRTRLNLLAVELMEEKSRVWLMLVLTGLALILASMALLTLSLLVVVAFWEENRLLAIGALLAFYIIATAVVLLVLRQKAKTGSQLFASTLRELSKDAEALESGFEADDVEDEDVDFDLPPRRRRG